MSRTSTIDQVVGFHIRQKRLENGFRTLSMATYLGINELEFKNIEMVPLELTPECFKKYQKFLIIT